MKGTKEGFSQPSNNITAYTYMQMGFDHFCNEKFTKKIPYSLTYLHIQGLLRTSKTPFSNAKMRLEMGAPASQVFKAS